MESSATDKTRRFLWEVCGHGRITDYLKSSIVNNQVSHAYIFAGGNGLGKETTVAKFIKTLFCSGRGEYLPCNECPACRQIDSKIHPDIYYLRRLIDEKTSKLKRDISVEQVRELKSKLSQSTLLRGWKIAIIEEAEALNGNSANSLLKVLEEPTAKTAIILITSDISRLPKTVLSRSLVLNFLPVRKEEIKEFLLSRGVGEEKAGRISRLALGRPGTAMTLAENPEALAEKQQRFADFINLFRSDLSARLSSIDTVISWEKDESLNIKKLIGLLADWQTALRDLILARNGNQADLADLRAVKEMSGSEQLSWGRILRADYFLAEAKRMLDANISSKNILENLVINL